MDMSPASPPRPMALPSPPAPISKRDKRRNLLSDRLAELSNEFQGNKDGYYRSQLQAIQTDVHLIMSAEVYDEENPLPDLAEDIRSRIQEATGMIPQANGMVQDVSPIAGKLYSEFIQEVQDALERRDADLATHKREYEARIQALNTSNQLKIKLAEKEHYSLASTLRDRLINSVTSKKARLLRDKEALDITDSNALLLHPSQFSITHPASPSGVHQKRTTRHRREVGEITNFPEENKRKRKGLDDDGSPAPTRRAFDNGSSTPIWRHDREVAAHKQFETPVYSIDKLFTEKELAMNYNHAAQAAFEYIVRHKVAISDGGSPPNGSSSSNASNPDPQNQNEERVDEAPNSPPTAPTMERQFSHATRSTRGLAHGNHIFQNGVEGIADIALPQNISRISTLMPKHPPLIPANMATSWRKETANQPQQATEEQIAADLYHIKQCKQVNSVEVEGQRNVVRSLDLNGDREVLRMMLAPPGQFQMVLAVGDDRIPSNEARREEASLGYSNLRGDGGEGGVAMSKQSSVGGFSEVGGGVAMSRSGTNDMSMGVGRTEGGGGGGRRRGRQI